MFSKQSIKDYVFRQDLRNILILAMVLYFDTPLPLCLWSVNPDC